MNRYETGFSRVCASQEMKARLYARLNDERQLLAAEPYEPRVHIGKKRKALLILIAAVLLLLSACAAYAVYWSSTQRIKEYSQSEQATDDRLAQSEQMADQAIEGTTYYSPMTDMTELDGISFAWKGASYWGNDSPPEMHLAFDATDAKTGDDSRLSDIDYVLSVGGKTYPAYVKADGTTRALPAIAEADDMAHGAEYEIWFRIDDQIITDGMSMKLTCTLYRWDASGQRGESLGDFSLDFVYRVPTEQIEADRQRMIDEYYAGLCAEQRETDAALNEQPDEAVALNIQQGVFTLHDVTVTQKGVLLGTTGQFGWYDTGVNTYYLQYLDGYDLVGEQLGVQYELYTEGGKNCMRDYPGKITQVKLLPWYADIADLPETVLVSILADGKTDVFGVGDGVEHTSKTEQIQIAFRVNPRTGEVILPKDDAERESWCQETLRLAADGRNENCYAPLNAEQTHNGVTVRLTRVGFQPKTGALYVSYDLIGANWESDLADLMSARIFIDDKELERWEPADYAPSTSERELERMRTYIDAYGSLDGQKLQHSGAGGGFLFHPYPAYLPESFELRFLWDFYDWTAEGERVFVGTYDITSQVYKKDIVPGELSVD